MAIQQNFPDEGPTLNLNFAGSRTLDPRITFTRTSSATYTGPDGLIKIAPVNSPRFDHSYNPTTGEIESLGLLIEEARTNLLLRSEEFDNASWTKTRSSITANTIVAPDGTLTGAKLVEDTTASNTHLIVQLVSWTSGVTYTQTIFAKKSERFLQFVPGGGLVSFANFDLDAGTVTVQSNCTATIQNVGNGWYRCSATVTAITTASGNFHFLLVTTSNAARFATYTGDGTSGLFLWGAQLEAGTFPTSYIPTTASTVTRTVDSASMTGTNFSNWYNPNEGTVYSSWIMPTIPSNVASFVASFSDGTNNNRFMHYKSEFGTTNIVRTSSAGVTANNSFGEINFNTIDKTIFGYSSGSTVTSMNGSPPNTVTQSVPTSLINTLYIGRGATGGSSGSILISQLTYYPTRLPNNILQNLTR